MSDVTPATPSFEQGAKIAARYAKAAAAIATVRADHAAKIAPLQAASDKMLAPHLAKLEAAAAEAKAWWDVHGEKARGKKKSAEIAGVVMGTRLSTAKLLFAHGNDVAAAALLLKGRLVKLLKRTISPDKTAITARLAEEAEKPEAERKLAEMGFSMSDPVDTFFIEPATHTGRKS